MAYFDLKVMRSYRGAAYSQIPYYFKKDTPTFVPEEDAESFRNQPDIFFECDEDGTPVFINRKEPESRSYKRYREYDIFGDENNDAESVLQKAFDQTVAERESKPVDVAALLNAVAEDTLEEPVKVEDGTITSDDITQLGPKKKTRKKLN